MVRLPALLQEPEEGPVPELGYTGNKCSEELFVLHMRSKQYIYKIPIMGHTHKFFRGKLLYVLRCPSNPWPLCLTKIFLFLFLRLAASLFCLDGFAASTTTCLERVPFHLGAEDQVPEHRATPHHSKWRKGTHHQH